MNAQQYQMMQVLQKIPLFRGLDVKQAMHLLKICRPTEYKPGQMVYAVGETSTEMLILLKGKLSVVGQSGEILASIEPGEATGEMGLFTGEPRSASVIAMEDSTGLVIRKPELMAVMSSDKEMHITVLYNVIALMRERLAEANRFNERLREESGEEEDEEEEGEEEEDEEEEYPGDEEEEDEEDLEYDAGDEED